MGVVGCRCNRWPEAFHCPCRRPLLRGDRRNFHSQGSALPGCILRRRSCSCKATRLREKLGRCGETMDSCVAPVWNCSSVSASADRHLSNGDYSPSGAPVAQREHRILAGERGSMADPGKPHAGPVAGNRSLDRRYGLIGAAGCIGYFLRLEQLYIFRRDSAHALPPRHVRRRRDGVVAVCRPGIRCGHRFQRFPIRLGRAG